MNKNRHILTGIFIEMGVIEIEYELNKMNVFTNYCANLRLAIGRCGADGFRRCDSMAIPGESEPFR